jgi:UDP-N-acetylglucosamine 2-epimerase (non-hydrolysing)
MIDSLFYALDKAKKSNILEKLRLINEEYVLVTLHRPTNVDEKENLREFIDIFSELSKDRKIVFPVHPRTRKNIQNFGFKELTESIKGLHLIEPLGYIDFLALMINSDFVITDSGGIQEETTALNIPCLTIRTTTERPVTVELGSNILVHPDKKNIQKEIYNMLNKPRKSGVCPKLWDGHTGERIADIIYSLFEKHIKSNYS